MEPEIHIFAGTAGKDFAGKMCRYLNVPLGQTEVIHFSEGNTYVKIGEHVRSREVYLVQPIGPDANNDFVELLFWLDAFKRSGADYVTVVMPYFSYAKGDKKDEPRVSIRARVCAECIELEGADRVITMDLHAPQIQGFFKKPVDHLFARPVLVNYLKTILPGNAVIVSPDSGNAKVARKYADDLGLPVAIGDKTRCCNDENAEILELTGDVSGKNAVIVDDFSISGGTVVNLAAELKKRGAEDIIACFSHIPLSRKGVEAIENSCIRTVISTDSLYNPNTAGMKKLKIISVAPLFAEAVKRMQRKESINDLFEDASVWMPR
ncbi:MAG: ribose-phosphate diphosphokinase [Treponema sp.]|nr:ribose-phosphate diphosphokinase [Treponema sp.]